jgi:hypothetical protein
VRGREISAIATVVRWSVSVQQRAGAAGGHKENGATEAKERTRPVQVRQSINTADQTQKEKVLLVLLSVAGARHALGAACGTWL